MDSHGFKTCSTVKFSSAARLLPSSWCPDKDLVLVITRTAGKDGLALWPREGGRKMWEVDIDLEASERAEVNGIAWSPDGKFSALGSWGTVIELSSQLYRLKHCCITPPTCRDASFVAGWPPRSDPYHPGSNQRSSHPIGRSMVVQRDKAREKARNT